MAIPIKRTKEEAIRDLDYVIRLNQRHSRLYERIYTGIRFMELIGGSLGIAAAFTASSVVLGISGACFALIGFVSFAYQPGERSRKHQITCRKFAAIRAEVGSLTMDEIDSRRRHVNEPNYIEGLRTPSWNDMMCSHGLEKEIKPLSRWQRFMQAIA